MFIQPFTADDILQLNSIQPEGWQPIAPVFEFYLQSSFCFPIKYSLGDTLSGVGAIIFHAQTAWLAHIIVSPDHRNKGIGFQITQELIRLSEKRHCKTTLLLATELGEPVYTKLGFKKELEYVFFQHAKPELEINPSIIPFENQYLKQIIELDQSISGEDRTLLLTPHLKTSRIILSHGKIEGYYLPTLGDGLIMAENSKAGLALLSARLTPEKNRIAFPCENKITTDYLVHQGFSEFRRASRMYLGEKLSWQPSKLYSRIGGNLG